MLYNCIFMSIEKRLHDVEAAVDQDPSILGLQAYEFLDNDLLKQQDKFIAGEPVQIEYPKLDYDELKQKEATIRGLILLLHDTDGSLKADALYEALSWRHTEVCMLGWASLTLAEQADAEARSWHQQANEVLHGKPEQETFDAMFDQEINAGRGLEISYKHTVAAQIQQELTELTGTVKTPDNEPFIPSAELVKKLGDLIKDEFKDYISSIDPDKTYTPAEIAEVFSNVLDITGFTDDGWSADLDDSNTLSVLAAEKKVKVGSNRKDILGSVLQSRTLHEIGVHGLRARNALQAGWQSAAYGQDSYLEFEEGTATAFEDAFNNEAKPHGWQYYIAIGLALGMDTDHPRNLRQVYDVIWRYKALQKYDGTGDLDPETIYKVKKVALRQCKRIFRGTDGETAGNVYYKDLSYYNGQAKAWSVLGKIEEPDDLARLLIGKLDLTKPFHQIIADEMLKA